MRRFLLEPLHDLASCLDRLADAGRPARAVCAALVSLVATWFVYVPLHELLHVLGCLLAGGTVSELQIAPQYGGALLARLFPFVVSGGDYAGRLAGFDTKGSDLIYLATDLMPYVLTIVVGVPLLAACARRRRPVLFGVGTVVGLAPFYNLIGDYYEMGSIVTTRVVTLLRGGGEPVAFAGIRSDDIFKLIGDVCTQPAALQLHGPTTITLAVVLIVVSLVVGAILALGTYVLGGRFARLFFSSPPGATTR